MEFINGVTYVSDVKNIPETIITIIITIILGVFVICVSALMIKFMFGELAYNFRNKNRDKTITLENILLFLLVIASVCNIIVTIMISFNCFFGRKADMYMVNISADVNMDEFINTYEIVKYDDDDRTFTIKVREK